MHDDLFDARAVRTFQTVSSCSKQELIKVVLAWVIDNSIHLGNVTTLRSIFNFGRLIHLLFFMNSFVVQHESQ